MVLERSVDGLERDTERAPLIVFSCCLHICHNREYELGIRGLKPKRLHLCVLRLQYLDVGADLLVKIKLLLQYFNECVKDARCGQVVCCHNHLGENLMQMPFVDLLPIAICL